jgi:hypothetical protein
VYVRLTDWNVVTLACDDTVITAILTTVGLIAVDSVVLLESCADASFSLFALLDSVAFDVNLSATIFVTNATGVAITLLDKEHVATFTTAATGATLALEDN